MHFVPYSLVAVHTWLLVLEPDLAYVMCQQSAGRCPYLGNTPVSLYSYVDGDISCKYILIIRFGRYLDEILRGFPRRYLIGCYQMRGVATGALGRTPPRTPT